MFYYIAGILLFGIVLTTLVLVVAYGLTQNTEDPDNDTNDGDGGIKIPRIPDLDLPPGVCLPVKKDNPEYEEELVV